MEHLDIKEIPAKHILKRWTRDAKDVLPDHLAHYQRDQMSKQVFTYRHSRLYMMAMQLVRMGDTSVDAYDKLKVIFKDAMITMKPYMETRDGLGLEDQQIAKQNGVVSGNNSGTTIVFGDGLDGLKPPAKKRQIGHPTNSRDKAPYEDMSKQTRFCSICKRPGHKSTTCPDRGDLPKKKPKKRGSCMICGVKGHRKDTCLKPRGQDGC
jgi:hypothetical protein